MILRQRFHPDDKQQYVINRLRGWHRMIGEMKLTNTAFVQVRVASAAATLITTVNTVVLANLKIQEMI